MKKRSSGLITTITVGGSLVGAGLLLGCLTMMRGGGAAAAASTVARVFQNETHGNYERLLF